MASHSPVETKLSFHRAPQLSGEEFLLFLGSRVRDLRNRRGMTRKTLAHESGVSERHLAQLESGEGNISILLLRRIATVLSISLEELFAPNKQDAQQNNEQNLIGLRGAGKSTLGSKLAAERKVSFIELDHEIEKDTGMPLPEIFSLYGQSGYRAIEKRTLERVLRASDRAVISVGGGIVSEKETYDYLLAHCYTIWLKAQPEEHMSRVIAQGDFRVMAGSDRAMEDLRGILESREPLYRKADASVDTSGDSVEESFIKLTAALQTASQ